MSWEVLGWSGRILGRSLGGLEGSWAAVGRLVAILGWSWEVLGPCWGAFGGWEASPRTARSDPPPPAQQASACCKSSAETFIKPFLPKVKYSACCCSKMLGAISFAHSAAPKSISTIILNLDGRPNSHQKRIQKSSKKSYRVGLVFGSSWAPSWGLLGAQDEPRSAQERPKRRQDRSKTPHDDHLCAKKHFFKK